MGTTTRKHDSAKADVKSNLAKIPASMLIAAGLGGVLALSGCGDKNNMTQVSEFYSTNGNYTVPVNVSPKYKNFTVETTQIGQEARDGAIHDLTVDNSELGAWTRIFCETNMLSIDCRGELYIFEKNNVPYEFAVGWMPKNEDGLDDYFKVIESVFIPRYGLSKLYDSPERIKLDGNDALKSDYTTPAGLDFSVVLTDKGSERYFVLFIGDRFDGPNSSYTKILKGIKFD